MAACVLVNGQIVSHGRDHDSGRFAAARWRYKHYVVFACVHTPMPAGEIDHKARLCFLPCWNRKKNTVFFCIVHPPALTVLPMAGRNILYVDWFLMDPRPNQKCDASNQQSCSQCCNAILRRHCNHRSYFDCDNKEKKQVFSSSQSSSLPFRFLNSRGCIPTPFTDLSENLIGSAPFLLVQAEQSSAVLLHKLAVHQYALPHGETAAPSWSGFFPGRSPYTWSPG